MQRVNRSRSVMIDPALIFLMRLLMRAARRHAWRSVKTPAGAFLAIFMLIMFAFGLVPMVTVSMTNGAAASSGLMPTISQHIPLVLFAMAVFLIATESGDSFLELKPAELQFVLAGPFTDTHILSYRLITLFLSWVSLCLVFSLFLLPHLGSFWGGVAGMVLGGAFIMLIAFQYTLVKSKLAPWVSQLIRLSGLFCLAAISLETSLMVIRSQQVFSTALVSEAVESGWVASICTTPFVPFAGLIKGVTGDGMLIDLLLSSMLVGGLLSSCYWSNAGFAELALEGVARRVKKLERVRAGNVYGRSARKAERSQLLPAFPWIGGVGPVAWSQITSVLRRSGRLVPGLLVIGMLAAVGALVYLRVNPDGVTDVLRTYAVLIAQGAAAYLGFLFTMSSQSGFAASRRLLTWYQVLPIHPFAIAAGMVWGMVLLLSVIQVAICLPALVLTSMTWMESLAILFAGASFSVVFASTVNLLAAATDLRPIPQGTPDVFQGARGLVFMMVLGMSMTPILLFAASAAAVAGVVLGISWISCSLAAGGTMLCISPALWWYSGARFVHREFSG